MKIKTSITLSSDILKDVTDLEKEFKNRSNLIEEALRFFLRKRLETLREQKDREILDKRAKTLNEEAEDVLSYQIDL